MLVLQEFLKMADKKEKQKIFKIYDKLELKGRHFSAAVNKKLYETFSEKLEKDQKSKAKKS